MAAGERIDRVVELFGLTPQQVNAALLRRAGTDERAVVTENAKDFDRIVRSWVATGEHHAGVVFTSRHRFHRGSSSYPEDLIVALTTFLVTSPVEGQADAPAP